MLREKGASFGCQTEKFLLREGIVRILNSMAWIVAAALPAGCPAWITSVEAASPAPVSFRAQPPGEISSNTDEPGRAGSESAFHVRNCTSGNVQLAEVLVFTKESIRRFDDECMRLTGFIDDDGCWESAWRLHVDDFRSERQAFDSGALPERYERVALNGVPFLVHEVVINSSGLTLREYLTYQNGRRLTIWVFIEPDASTDTRSVRPADRKTSDRLAGMLEIEATLH